MTEPKKKVPRSVSIDKNVYDRIESICARFGVNVNAYLLQAIGEKLYRDESLLRIEEQTAQATSASLDKIVSIMEQMEKQK